MPGPAPCRVVINGASPRPPLLVIDYDRAGASPEVATEGSAIGAHYRHTTPEMAARVVAAVEERLVIVLTTAEAALNRQPW